MTSSGVERYWQRFEELLDARRRAGGELSEEEESNHVAALDELWHGLSNLERAEIERELELED